MSTKRKLGRIKPTMKSRGWSRVRWDQRNPKDDTLATTSKIMIILIQNTEEIAMSAHWYKRRVFLHKIPINKCRRNEWNRNRNSPLEHHRDNCYRQDPLMEAKMCRRKFEEKWDICIEYLLWVSVKLLSHVWFFATPWTIAYQAPPSMGFSRQEYWSGLPLPSPGDLCWPRNWTRVSHIAADALPSEPPGKPLRYF